MESSSLNSTQSASAALTRCEKHLDAYVKKELDFLSGRAKMFEARAHRWYLFVFCTLLTGVVYALCVGVFTVFRSFALSFPHQTPPPPATWLDVVRNVASSLIFIGMLSAVVRFAYVMGKSCMVEAIRNNNRRHAISFGEFYLKAFGDRVTWADARDAFSSWNIDIGTSFLTQSASDVDPQLLQNLAAVFSAIKKAKEKE